ncbi:MAG TPA: hypothetical protein VFK42_10935 [Acidimicrobiales bacterium]|nr:hypothetical protein [Acidimicrobiales bacterium]
MRLRRLLAALFATCAFTGVLAGPALAGKPFTDSDGSCADYTDGSVTYLADGTIGGNGQLATTACKNLSYTLNVYPAGTELAPGSTVPIARFPATSITNEDLSGDGVPDTGNLLWANLSVPGAPAGVCVTLTSNQNRNTTLDVVPDFTDAGCGVGAYIAKGGSGAGSWH